MRKKSRFIAWILVAFLLCGQMPIQAYAQEVQHTQTVSDGDVEGTSVIPDEGSTEGSIEIVDVSDRVYQSGGWGTPGKKSNIAFFALDAKAQLKAAILNALQQDAAYLDISSYNLTFDDLDDLYDAFAGVLNEHSELFYVQSQMGYSYSGDNILGIYFYYEDFTMEERQAFAEKLEQATQMVRPDMTDVEKAMVLHDYLAQNCAYAYSEYLEGTLGSCENVYNAYGALVEGKAVCQGYALAYNFLLNAVGIYSDLCTSRAMNHAWNIVLIDDEWYHVDVTWDDPVWNREGRARHFYFLLSDLEMNNREHHSWEAIAECTSAKYDAQDYWWNAIDSQIVLTDKQYYIESIDRGFQLTERDGDVTTSKFVKNTVWEVWDGSGYWGGSYSYLSKQGDYLYFNDKQNLYAMKLTDSTPQVIYTYEGDDGYIYGAMVYEDGTARLNINTTPNSDNDNYILVNLSAEAPTLTVDYEAGTISTTTNMEYSLDGGKTWSHCTENMQLTDFGWSGIKDITVFFRMGETGGCFTSDTIEVTLKTLPGVMRGTVTCFGDDTLNTTLQLLDSNGVIIQETSTLGNNAEFAFRDVSSGTYTLQVSKANHVTREYTVAVGSEAVSVDVTIWLKGDVNGDGNVTVKDKKVIFNHMEGTSVLTDYAFAVGDVDGNGDIVAKDKKIIYNHIEGNSLLW